MGKGAIISLMVSLVMLSGCAPSGPLIPSRPTPFPEPTAELEYIVTPTLAVPSPAPTPIVVFENESSIPSIDKSQLQSRIIAPYLEYYREASEGAVISLTISANTQPNKDVYPYLGSGIFTTGAHHGFVVERGGKDLKWWYPECMSGCVFSDNFKAKYPEVIANTLLEK